MFSRRNLTRAKKFIPETYCLVYEEDDEFFHLLRPNQLLSDVHNGRIYARITYSRRVNAEHVAFIYLKDAASKDLVQHLVRNMNRLLPRVQITPFAFENSENLKISLSTSTAVPLRDVTFYCHPILLDPEPFRELGANTNVGHYAVNVTELETNSKVVETATHQFNSLEGFAEEQLREQSVNVLPKSTAAVSDQLTVSIAQEETAELLDNLYSAGCSKNDISISNRKKQCNDEEITELLDPFHVDDDSDDPSYKPPTNNSDESSDQASPEKDILPGEKGKKRVRNIQRLNNLNNHLVHDFPPQYQSLPQTLNQYDISNKASLPTNSSEKSGKQSFTENEMSPVQKGKKRIRNTRRLNNDFPPQYPSLPKNLKQYEALLPEYNRPAYEEPGIKKIIQSASLGRNSLRYFCPYCRSDLAALPRHLESVHPNELLVKRAMALPKGNSERIDILKAIRLWGAAIYNDNRSYNKGTLRIRRRMSGPPLDTSRYTCCPHCSGMFYKRRFIRHVQKCSGKEEEHARSDPLRSGRSLVEDVHASANSILKYRIFPYFINDECVQIIRYDKAIIALGNYLALKFSLSPHHDKQIRSNLRLMGRLLIKMRRKNKNISDLASAFIPSNIDLVASSVRKLAGFNMLDGTYKHPSTATFLTAAVKSAADQWLVECIKREDLEGEKKVERFKLLFNISAAPIINKTVVENRSAAQRKKKVMLPTEGDMTRFCSYLESGYQHYTNILKNSETFHFTSWKNLGAYLLVYIVYFNKRRPGEFERTYLSNYNNILELNSEHPSYNDFSSDDRILAERYNLFVIRGKLNRTVNVLLDKNVKKALDVFVSFRDQAGVHNSNPYLFGLPGGSKTGVYPHLKTCDWIRRFSKECGAKDPKMLRCTILRKSLATLASNMNLPEQTVTDLADHMGHQSNIHKNIYRQATYDRSVVSVAATLEQAAGKRSKHKDREEPTQRCRTDPNIPAASCKSTRKKKTKEAVAMEFCRVARATTTLDKKAIRNSVEVRSATTSHEDGCSEFLLEAPLKETTSNCQVTENSSVVFKTPSPHKGKSFSRSNSNVSADSCKCSAKTKTQEAAAMVFYNNMKTQLSRKPTLKELEGALQLPELQRWSLPELKLFYDNIGRHPKQQKQRYSSPQSCRTRDVRERRAWTPRAKQCLRKLYKTHINSPNAKLPSLNQLRYDIATYSPLKGRSAAVVKTAIHNERKRTLDE